MAVAVGLFGLLSIGGWTQDYFTAMADQAAAVGADPGADQATAAASAADYRHGPVYTAFGLAVLLPVLVAAAWVADSLRLGGLKSLVTGLGTTRLLGALAGLKFLAIAVIAGVLRVVVGVIELAIGLLDLMGVDTESGGFDAAVESFELAGRSVDSGVFNAIAVAGLAAAAAGLWHWSPRLFGSPAAEPLGWAAVGLLSTGGALMVGSDVIAGFLGAGDLPAPAAAVLGHVAAVAAADTGGDMPELAVVASAGSLILAAGLLCLLAGTATAVLRTRSRATAAVAS